MASAIVVLFFLPWLDRSPVKSMRYKGTFSRVALIVFAAAFVILGYLGVKSPTPARTILSQICTVVYFAYFIGMPFWTTREKTLPEPDRVQMKGLSKALVFGGLALFLALVIVPIKAVASTGGACGKVPCEHFEADLSDKESLQAGAQTFINYCMGCHEASFSRYERVADDLGIDHKLMLSNMIFTGQKIGGLMEIGMTPDSSKAWFGGTPPDLTLATRARQPEWVYTFLKSFYRDDSRPKGVNNKVFENVGMPHVLLELQGLPECAPGDKRDDHGKVIRNDMGKAKTEPCGSLVVGDVKGSLTAEEYDQKIYNLVNFMSYMAEPIADKRVRIGVYVFLFLSVLLVFTVLLNREYWKDVH